jgi:hypothetical protein
MSAHQLELATIKRDWIDDAAWMLEPILHRLGRFTADDLHPLLPTPRNHNWFGILVARLSNRGLIRRVNAVPSRRPEANGRLVSVWEAV